MRRGERAVGQGRGAVQERGVGCGTSGMLLAVAGDVAPGAGRGRAWCWSIGGFALRTFVPAACGGGRSRLAAWPQVCPESASFCSVPSVWRAGSGGLIERGLASGAVGMWLPVAVACRRWGGLLVGGASGGMPVSLL